MCELEVVEQTMIFPGGPGLVETANAGAPAGLTVPYRLRDWMAFDHGLSRAWAALTGGWALTEAGEVEQGSR